MKTRLKQITGGVAALTVAGSLAVQTVGGFEGLRLYAYRDVIGIWTACYGSTKGIKPGMRFSKADCDNLLVGDLIEHEQGMRRCLKDPDALPIKVYVAELSLTFNIGVGAFCRSTVARRTNAGDLRGACDAIPLFNKAGGKVIKGLVKRRAQERALCLEAA